MRALISDYCARIGQDPLLVQGAGGNVSWKDSDVLWIKASGTWLRDAKSNDIFVPVALPELQLALRDGQFDAQPRTLGETKLKPSIETVLHALLRHKIVVHVHAIGPLSWLVRDDAISCVEQLIPAGLDCALVPYRKPGKELAQAVSEALEAKPNARVVLLMNHGIVVGGDNLTAVEETLRTLLLAFKEEASISATTLQASDEPTALPLNAGQSLTPLPDARLQRLALTPSLFKRVQQDWALYPDHVVFLGGKAITFSSAASAASAENLPVDMPIFIQGLGVFSLAPLTESKLTQLRCYQNVIERHKPDTVLRSLKVEDVANLLNWDAERYRQQLNR